MLPFSLFVLKMILLLKLILLKLDCLDLKVFVRLRPASCCIRFELRSWYLELDKARKSWQDPVLDELSQDDLQLASLGINLLSQMNRKCEQDLLKFEIAYLYSFGVNQVLGNNFLVPLDF